MAIQTDEKGGGQIYTAKQFVKKETGVDFTDRAKTHKKVLLGLGLYCLEQSNDYWNGVI